MKCYLTSTVTDQFPVPFPPVQTPLLWRQYQRPPLPLLSLFVRSCWLQLLFPPRLLYALCLSLSNSLQIRWEYSHFVCVPPPHSLSLPYILFYGCYWAFSKTCIVFLFVFFNVVYCFERIFLGARQGILYADEAERVGHVLDCDHFLGRFEAERFWIGASGLLSRRYQCIDGLPSSNLFKINSIGLVISFDWSNWSNWATSETWMRLTSYFEKLRVLTYCCY